MKNFGNFVIFEQEDGGIWGCPVVEPAFQPGLPLTHTRLCSKSKPSFVWKWVGFLPLLEKWATYKLLLTAFFIYIYIKILGWTNAFNLFTMWIMTTVWPFYSIFFLFCCVLWLNLVSLHSLIFVLASWSEHCVLWILEIKKLKIN